MGKFLSTKELAELKAKADNYDAIVQSVMDGNKELKAEEVTLDIIQSAISGNAGEEPEVQSTERIKELESEVSKLKDEKSKVDIELESTKKDLDEAKSTIEELEELPGSESVSTKKPKAEASAVVTDDLLSFAQSNKGDTTAILAKMKEEGIL